MPLIQIVDENDQPIGGATKQEAWDKGLFHRIVRIIMLDEKGRMFLQHRASTKQPFPSHWDNSCAGHVDEGESYEVAAERELREETGIENVKLKEIDYYLTQKTVDGRKLNRFNKVFTIEIDSLKPIVLDPTEADEGKWFTKAEAKVLVEDPNALLTSGLRKVILEHFL